LLYACSKKQQHIDEQAVYYAQGEMQKIATKGKNANYNF
jgi:hypothetical protein